MGFPSYQLLGVTPAKAGNRIVSVAVKGAVSKNFAALLPKSDLRKE